MQIENNEYTFDHVVARRYTFGNIEFSFKDNMNTRKAWLHVINKDTMEVKELASWESSDEKGKWVASALVSIIRQLRDKRFNKTDQYCVFCCLGMAMSMPNTGRYWHELKHPHEIEGVMGIVRSKTGRMITIRGMGETVQRASEQRKLNEFRAAL